MPQFSYPSLYISIGIDSKLGLGLRLTRLTPSILTLSLGILYG